MGNTAPNQKVIVINKQGYKANFLQIGLKEIQEAGKKYNHSTLCLYLYLAGNANNYELALSPVAFENAFGVSKSRYYEAFKQLEKDGYIVKDKGNRYNFYTTPPKEKQAQVEQVPKMGKEIQPNDSTFPTTGKVCPKNGKKLSQNWIEKQIIDNDDRQEGIGHLFSEPIGSSNQVSYPTIDGFQGEVPIVITELELSQVINKEAVGENLWRINGKLFQVSGKPL